MRGVALFNNNYLVQGGDISFHIQMLDLRLERSSPLVCKEHIHKCIIATKHEYFLVSYDDKEQLLTRYGLIETYKPEDFVNAIKSLFEE